MSVAAYVRVSTTDQDDTLQRNAIAAYCTAQQLEPTWYADQFSGKTMARPSWTQLEADLLAGKIKTLIVWKLDRLGRTALGLHTLFEELQARSVRFVSLTEGMDLGTAMGRLTAGVLASVAEFEREIRAERQRAGIEAKRRKDGTLPWAKGRKRGGLNAKTKAALPLIRKLHAEGLPNSRIAQHVGLSRDKVAELIRERLGAQPS